MHPPRTEQDLVAALRRGERDAAEQLARDSYRQTFAALVQLCAGNRDLAADLTQETYRRAWASIDSFRGSARFSSWLYRIAYNTFLNHQRGRDRLRPLPDDAAERFPDQQATPAQQTEAQLRSAAIQGVLRELPDQERYLLSAVYWGEVPIRELAEQESITVVAVRKRLKKAQSLFRKRLQALSPSAPPSEGGAA